MPKTAPEGVDWPTLVGRDLGTPRTQVGGAGQVPVLTAADELSSYRDLDTVYRRAVELSRECIGLERASLFLYDSAAERLIGTWGTGLAGDTTDEHHIFFTAGFHHREATAQALAGVSRWMVFQDVPLVVRVDDESRVIGSGWNAITPILGRAGPIGLMANDAARSGTALDESKQVQTAIFCRLLGSLIEDLRRSSEELPWPSLLSSLPRVGKDSRQSLVLSVVHALHRDPTLTGRDLAKRLGANGPRLGQTFADDMGMSLVEYRNRLRIERFFSLVAPGGGNLMQAALDAGFGSYAQFHRVFRDLVGATPKEYLTRRR